MLQLLIKGGTCVNATGTFEADIGITGETITHIGQALDLPAERVIDARSRLVMPGVIDTHVHLPWPSSRFNSTDNYTSGSLAAIHGGVTTLIEYVVPDESGHILPALEKQMAEAESASYVDFTFHIILRKVTDETLQELAEAVKRGLTSFKIYTAYQGFRLGDEDVLTILKTAKELGALTCFHAEDGVLVDFAVANLAEAGKTDVRYYPEAHPAAADISATQRVITYAKHLDARVHIVHVNTGEAARMIGAARREGWSISGETCPQYLVFTEDAFKSGQPEANYFVLAPCMRTVDDREALWQAVASGDLQMIATDHCPYTSQQKLKGAGDFRRIPGGAAGIETSLPVVYTYGVTRARFPASRFVELMATNPARIFSLFPRKGIIAVGSDADLIIYDPAGTSRIDIEDLHSNTDHTLYQGMEVAGRLEQTILRGRVLMEGGQLAIREPSGRFLARSPDFSANVRPHC